MNNAFPMGAPPDIDTTFTWKGNGQCGNWKSYCRLRIFRPHPEQTVVIVSAIKGDTGTSITNSAPKLAELVCQQYGIAPATLMWIEQYPYYRGTPEFAAEFSQVILTWQENRVLHHTWQTIGRQEIEQCVLFPL
ncbi:hypothetical protein [Leptolyngbya sp. AN10]|uniref:hypothetical protein n=1 Tax=Leptolyngbya sp. AN10 TaxID=3423365 RepID=UPI003D311500